MNQESKAITLNSTLWDFFSALFCFKSRHFTAYWAIKNKLLREELLAIGPSGI